MDVRIGILIILIIVVGNIIIPMIIIRKPNIKPILAGVYETKTGNVRVTVIGIERNTVSYEFEDPDDFKKLKKGSMKLTEFDNIFTYLYTDYKTLVYKINKTN
jgi:hypothetical protein